MSKKDRDADFEKQVRKLGREIRKTPKDDPKGGKNPPPPKRGK